MRKLIRTGISIAVVLVIAFVSNANRVWKSFQGEVRLDDLKPGMCIQLTDGPIVGSGADAATEAEIEASFADEEPEDYYPKVDCDKWAKADKPWQVYKVDKVGGAALDPSATCGASLWLQFEVDNKPSTVCLDNLESSEF